MSAAMTSEDTTRCELPEGGISLLGYIVRRMHKTALLESAVRRLAEGQKVEALLDIAVYAAAASISYGDSDGQLGNLILDRDGNARVAVVADGTMWERRVDVAAAPWRVPDNVLHRAETTPVSPG